MAPFYSIPTPDLIPRDAGLAVQSVAVPSHPTLITVTVQGHPGRRRANDGAEVAVPTKNLPREVDTDLSRTTIKVTVCQFSFPIIIIRVVLNYNYAQFVYCVVYTLAQFDDD